MYNITMYLIYNAKEVLVIIYILKEDELGMKKKFVSGAMIIMIIIFIVGVALIFNSSGIGEKAGNVALHSQGGTMDTSSFQRIINTTTTNFQIVGTILSLIGGFGVLISGYALYKEL
jgi:hypothetical protein